MNTFTIEEITLLYSIKELNREDSIQYLNSLKIDSVGYDENNFIKSLIKKLNSVSDEEYNLINFDNAIAI